MKYLIFVLLIVTNTGFAAEVNIVLGGWSKHIIGDHYKAGNGYNGSSKKQHTETFNDSHNVAGLSVRHNTYRLSAFELDNSYYQKARAIEASKVIAKNYSLGFMVSSGYANTDGGMFGDFAVMPTIKYESNYYFVGVFGVAALAGFTVPLN